MNGSLSWARIAAVARREWIDLRRNKSLISSAIFVPLLFTAMSIGFGLLVEATPAGKAFPPGKAPPWMTGNPTEREASALLFSNVVVMFFMIMPTTLPSIMAAHSIVGEKLARTLEPVLATPLRTVEIVLGKLFTFVLIGVVPAYAALAVFTLVMHLRASPDVVQILCGPRVLMSVIAIAPPIAVLAVCTGMLISTRATDVQSAQAWSGIITLPVIGFMMSQLFGVVTISAPIALGIALVLGMVDCGVVLLVASVFERETILTRWR